MGLKCSDDSPLGPAYPTYPRAGLPDDRVLFGRTDRYPGVAATLPLSREDVYADKRSARDGYRNFFGGPLRAVPFLDHLDASAARQTTRRPIRATCLDYLQHKQLANARVLE